MTTQSLWLLGVLMALAATAAAAVAWRTHRKLALLRKLLTTAEEARKRDHVLLQEARRQIEQLKARSRLESGPSLRPLQPRFEPVAPVQPTAVRQAKGFLFFGGDEPKTDFKDTQILEGFAATRMDEP